MTNNAPKKSRRGRKPKQAEGPLKPAPDPTEHPWMEAVELGESATPRVEEVRDLPTPKGPSGSYLAIHRDWKFRVLRPREREGFDLYCTLLTAIHNVRCGVLKVRTKAARVVPLEPNPIQTKLLDLWEGEALDMRPIQEMIVKARQEGVSTIVAAVMYEMFCISDGFRGLVVTAEKSEMAAEIWSIYDTFTTYDERWLPPNRVSRQTMQHAMRGGAKAKEMSHAELQVTSALSRSGRSGARHGVHLTEFDYWRNPEEALAGIEGSIPDHVFAFKVLESTGSKPGGSFHQLLEQNRVPIPVLGPDGDVLAERAPGTWRTNFFGWQSHHEYRLNLTEVEKEALENDLTSYERALLSKHGCSLEQVAWYRAKLRSMNGDHLRMKKEFPTTEEEAFGAARNSYFGGDVVDWYRARCKPPSVFCGVLRPDETIREGLMAPRALDESPLWVWEGPTPGAEYIITGDAASSAIPQNKDQARHKSGSGIVVLNATHGRIAATWFGIASGGLLAHIMAALGWRYNRALLCPEAEAQGHRTVQALIREIRYPHLYHHQREGRVLQDVTDSVGWQMRHNDRALAIEALLEAVRDRRLHAWCERMWRQMGTFEVDKSNKAPKAAAGCRDELVICAAMACAIAVQRKYKWNSMAITAAPDTEDFAEQVEHAREKARKVRQTVEQLGSTSDWQERYYRAMHVR